MDPIGTCPRKPRNYKLDYKTRKLNEKLEEDNDQETRNPNKHTFQKTLDILNPTPNGNRLKNSKYRTQESINPLCQVVSSQEYKIASTLTKMIHSNLNNQYKGVAYILATIVQQKKT